MSGYLFVHICMHVTYSNKIMVNEPVTTFPIHERACYIDTSKKQDESHQYRQHSQVREKRYSLVYKHKNRSEITGQRPCRGRAYMPNGTATLSTPKNMTDLGVRGTAVSVR